MAEHVAIEIIKRHGKNLSFNRCNQGIVVRSETSKKERKGFMRREGLSNGGKGISEMGKFVEIVSNGGVTLL